MKVFLLSCAFLVTMCVLQVNSECCPKTTIYLKGQHLATVCGDGRVHDEKYCGLGKCDQSGCDCDRGCIGGNALDNFKEYRKQQCASKTHEYEITKKDIFCELNAGGIVGLTSQLDVFTPPPCGR